jgi:deoxyribose-phosphate aldolase
MGKITVETLAQMIDHTALKPETTERHIHTLCDEALRYNFGAVCIAPTWIKLAAKILKNSQISVATVIGFPHGNTLTRAKIYEARKAIEEGARELDMVINIGALKSSNRSLVQNEISDVVEVAQGKGGICVKVILETALLSKDEKIFGCKIAEAAGADFVKTSTGCASKGATVEDVALFRQIIGQRLGIKAAGGIHNFKEAFSMIDAGATRIGCSSSVIIIEELIERRDKNDADP